MHSQGFPIIGIGASAGGIDAFHSFFDNLPADCGMAFVMILHLPPHRKSLLTDILSRWTSLRVMEAIDGTRIEPNTVYVPPPHSIVLFYAGCLHVQYPETDSDRLFRPIDGFFDSLAHALRENAIGIVLSGTGSDGALGLKAIKEYGGLTLAQGSNGLAPLYGQMPAGAIATGAVDLILPVEQMPRELMRLTGRDVQPVQLGEEVDQTDRSRLEICAILRSQLGHDFSGYRAQTFLRRVARRMQVVDVDTLSGYMVRLKEDHDEVSLLFRDLLIRVTSFFRDRDTFEALATKVIPQLFEGKGADAFVRVWVPGCATGEEAYSLAMLLREHVDSIKGVPRAQIFATDIDDSAIATARSGRYPTTLLEGLADERRDRFFTLSQGSYVVSKEIRDICTFSTHDLVRDPPFSRMDLVSCRNLLIYMNKELQEKVIPAFHYALVPKGILLLGGAESVSQHTDLFEPLDKVSRIFRRRSGESPGLQLGLQQPSLDAPANPPKARRASAPSAEAAPAPGNEGAVAANVRRPADFNYGRRRSDQKNFPRDALEPLLQPLPATLESVGRLQTELRSSGERLHSLEEEHQTALEELRSSNEELHSVNEEMQSTNEELETSKEELQSLNEELHTVNSRLNEKIDELDQINGDLRNLFDSTQIATVFLDRHLIIRSFTPAIATLYNLIPSDQGRPLTDIVGRLKYGTLKADVAQVLATLEPLERRVVRDDELAHYIMRILPYREPDSTVSGALVTFVDVTSIVKAESALVAADIAKDVFLATLSHELRNPLAPIRTATHVLESPNLTPTQLARSQAIIARQVRHMSSLLDDLLDVSRITRGAFLLKKEYVDVQALLDAAVESAQPLIDARQHTLRMERLPAPLCLEVDTVRITQVINNLLTNAAKYTPNGGQIHAGVRLDSHVVTIYVRDNGLGVAPEMKAKVFDMFTQIDSDVRRTEGGLGIGLALSKGLVELHGGRLEVHSDGANQGSEFRVVLPGSLVVSSNVTETGAEMTVDPPPPRRVLVADDNQDGAETMGMLLEFGGHEVHLAFSGAAALEIAKRLKPDIVILDIGMPDLDGYEVAQRIRHEAWGEHVLLIAVTGWGQADDKRRAAAAGFDHHLTKPVDPVQLERLFTAG